MAIGSRRVQTQDMPSVKLSSAREAARGGPDQRVLRGSAECGEFSSSALERSKRVGRMRRSRNVGGERDVPCGKVRADASRGSGCHEPDIGVSFARRAESSSNSARSRRVHDRVA